MLATSSLYRLQREHATYETKHVTVDCECSLISVPYDRLIQIIRDGGIPLLSINDDNGAVQPRRIEVYSCGRNAMYTAISHIWIDGLGNPKENGVPLCQSARLKAQFLALRNIFEHLDVSTFAFGRYRYTANFTSKKLT